jgi:uncharacterized protein (DUF58 family)
MKSSTSDLLKKVRKIEIKSRGLSNQIFSGEYHSAFKGRGMAFSEVREYMPGDDVRSIDWNVTARFNHPFVKVFEEERELTVMLMVDVSASEMFGTRSQLKMELVAELCAVIAFSALQNNDKIGVIFFSSIIEKFIPPKKGKSHVLRIIRELLDFNPKQKGTNLSLALQYFTNMIKKRCTAFLISDFFDRDFQKPLKIAARKHDLIALNIFDQREADLPNMGLVCFTDAETGETKWVDTSDAKLRLNYRGNSLRRKDELFATFRKSGVDFTTLQTGEPYVRPLLNLFKMREKK